MWNFLVNLGRFVLSFKNTVQKEYLVHWQILYVALLLFTTCPLPSHPYTVQSSVSSGSCHHPERTLARSLRAGNSNLWSRHCWRMLLHPLTQEFCNTAFLVHVTFTCTKSRFGYPYKVFYFGMMQSGSGKNTFWLAVVLVHVSKTGMHHSIKAYRFVMMVTGNLT